MFAAAQQAEYVSLHCAMQLFQRPVGFWAPQPPRKRSQPGGSPLPHAFSHNRLPSSQVIWLRVSMSNLLSDCAVRPSTEPAALAGMNWPARSGRHDLADATDGEDGANDERDSGFREHSC